MKKFFFLVFLFTFAFFNFGFTFDPALLNQYDGEFRDSILYLDEQGVFTVIHMARILFLKI